MSPQLQKNSEPRLLSKANQMNAAHYREPTLKSRVRGSSPGVELTNGLPKYLHYDLQGFAEASGADTCQLVVARELTDRTELGPRL